MFFSFYTGKVKKNEKGMVSSRENTYKADLGCYQSWDCQRTR